MAGDAEAVDAIATAELAGLRYVTDDRPGITRRRAGRGFSYRAPDGSVIRDRRRVEQLKALAIPPAWRDVWICPNPNGHLLATGRDARGRKQYRYHPRWRSVRDATKFDRMVPFGRALPDLRARVARDLELRGLPREKVLAAVLRLIDVTLMRVGNDEYARLNDSFGASTMRNDHASVRGGRVRLAFRSKHGRAVQVRISDRRLARIVRRCQDLPGEELFGYLDELGAERDVRSEDVNDYLREVAGADFTVKNSGHGAPACSRPVCWGRSAPGTASATRRVDRTPRSGSSPTISATRSRCVVPRTSTPPCSRRSMTAG